MSSPAGLHFSQADFLARWMPNSSRAGVILAPCPGVSSGPRLPTAEGPNDSFISDFGPLPASADSSCVAGDGCPRPPEGCPRRPGGDTAGSDGPLKGRSSDGELDSSDPMERQKQPPTLTMKLEQVRPGAANKSVDNQQEYFFYLLLFSQVLFVAPGTYKTNLSGLSQDCRAVPSFPTAQHSH